MKWCVVLVMIFFGVDYACAYEICGPNVIADEVSYTTVTAIGDGGASIGYWAVGTECDGHTTGEDVETMCSNVFVGGVAFCAGDPWTNSDLKESTARVGGYCWCRRTKVQINGSLIDSVGQAVLIDVSYGYWDSAKCNSNCARMCAESVALNENGMRNPIMVLPAF